MITGKVRFDDRKATMLGYAPEEFPGRNTRSAPSSTPRTTEVTIQATRDYLEGRSASWDLVYRMRRKDGSYAWYYDNGEIVERTLKGAPAPLGYGHRRLPAAGTGKGEGDQAMKLELILENNPLAKSMADAQGFLTYANEKVSMLRRTFDYPEWRIQGVDERELPAEGLPFAIIKHLRLLIRISGIILRWMD